MLIALVAAIACVNDNVNVRRRSCAFGSYELFKIHVRQAMDTLGCDATCNGCSLSSLDDCETIGVIAAYSEEAGQDSALERLHLASAHCLVPGGFRPFPPSTLSTKSRLFRRCLVRVTRTSMTKHGRFSQHTRGSVRSC